MYWQRHDDLNGAAATEQLYADHIGLSLATTSNRCSSSSRTVQWYYSI